RMIHMSRAVRGAGSFETIIGTYLSETKEDVEVSDVDEEHVQALNEKGATLVGTINKNIPVRAITPEQMTGTYDLVLLLTKQVFNEQVLHSLKPYLRNDSMLLSMQNGVPE